MNEILEGLNPPQVEAAQKTEGPLLILAGAGSGKTKTIIHRLAYLIHQHHIPPWQIVAVTFTNKACQEMQERALQIAGEITTQCMIRTYHSFGLYLLRCHAVHINYPSNFTIWSDSDQRSILEEILKSKLSQGKMNQNQMKYLSGAISTFKEQLVSPKNLLDEVDVDNYKYCEILPELYLLYERQKEKACAIDFSDMIYQNIKIFERKPEVLVEMHQKYRYFLIDEYQDTNRAQYVFIQLLAKAHRNLCVVGDDDQAIYGWRGADVNNILDFHKDFPDAHVIKLEQNYRSHQSILDISNSIIQNNYNRMPKKLWTEVKKGSEPQLMSLQSPIEEAAFVSGVIKSVCIDIPYREVGVLYRTNAQSRLLEEELLRNEIPYRIYGGVSFFERKEVRDTLAYLRFLVNPNDEAAFRRMISFPSRGVGAKTIEKINQYRDRLLEESHQNLNFLELMKQSNEIGLSGKVVVTLSELSSWIDEFHRQIRKPLDLTVLLDEVLEKSGVQKTYEEEDRLLDNNRLENLQELRNSVKTFQERQRSFLLDEYLQEISLYSSTQDVNQGGGGNQSGGVDSVNLMTIHNAKGLEFETVFILSLDDDIIPHYLAKKEQRYEEERRLLYVAITRAKNRLYMTRCLRRMNYGFWQNTSPSMFLSEMN